MNRFLRMLRRCRRRRELALLYSNLRLSISLLGFDPYALLSVTSASTRGDDSYPKLPEANSFILRDDALASPKTAVNLILLSSL